MSIKSSINKLFKEENPCHLQKTGVFQRRKKMVLKKVQKLTTQYN